MSGSRAIGSLPLILVLIAPVAAAADEAPASELREVVELYAADRTVLQRRYPVERSPQRVARLKRFHEEWRARVARVDFEPLGLEGRLDHILLRNEIDNDAKLLGRYEGWLAEAAPLLPFAPVILGLNDARLGMETLDASKAASVLDALAQQVEASRKEVEAAASQPDKPAAFRAQEAADGLKRVLESWYQFYAGYDPLFTWWAAAPYKKTVAALDDYRKALREKVLGIRLEEDEPIVGRPIGREALVSDLASEFIPYAPEDLLAVADREFAWCEAEMKKAARDMGLGEDWKAAVEKVKTLHVEPGKQPDLIRDLAREAEAYLEQHDLITVPPLAREVWRMQMMTPERQKVNPFFTGGEVISVSFPTEGMDHADKLMSLRGNNIHFARATVHHELIPGHHLQGFMTQRHHAHRRAFQTPFWSEGWALYWEMILWDRGFAKTPENRVGMLFWRMHRAARIIFSLRFHLGTMTPQECIDFLVDRVGHERANAAAEVRRSFNGSYPPLYQLAYMMGGLQFKALHAELVGSGKMTDRQFHDAVLTGGPMPVELVRARLLKLTLPRDYRASWQYAGERPAAKRSALPTPPPTRRDDVKEVLHGVEIVDPYRWLEDGRSPETRAWIEAQNRHLRALLDGRPGHEAIRSRLTALNRYDVMSVPQRRGERYFIQKRRLADDLSILYARTGLDGADEVILDPHPLSADHTVDVDVSDISEDGRLLVYGLRRGGEDETELHVRDVARRADLPDVLPRGLYRGVSLKPDGSGFYYAAQDRQTGVRIRYHAMGTPAGQDVEVFGRGYGPSQWIGASVSENGRHLLLTVQHGWGRNEVFVQDLAGGGPIRTVVKDVDAHFRPVFVGDRLIVQTDWKAPRWRVVEVDLKDPDPEGWREIVPQGPDAVQGIVPVGGKLLVHYLHNVTSQLKLFSLEGPALGEVALPGLGSVAALQGRWERDELLFSFSSYTEPRTTYRADVRTGKVEAWWRPQVPFDSAAYETKQVWYASKDGTKVPMFVTHRKGLALDGQRPALLYGYGGFNVSLTPGFSAAAAWWLEQGGVYAVANLRGGGEFGEEWHRAGMLENKQNVFDDFIAAAEWLIANRYTSPERLAIRGGSNGGLLVGAALTQRPELFRAVLCDFPDLDMVGYHRFEGNNPPALLEYGNAALPEQFKFLYAYSPYQKVKPGTKYPAVFLSTGDADTRVPPLQARKMAARLQAATSSGRPVVLLYDVKAGHAGGRPIGKVIEDQALQMAFLAWQLELEPR
jgi:prolyl oligopeptidase